MLTTGQTSVGRPPQSKTYIPPGTVLVQARQNLPEPVDASAEVSVPLGLGPVERGGVY